MLKSKAQLQISIMLMAAFLLASSGCALFNKDKKVKNTENLSAEALYGDAKESMLKEQWTSGLEKLQTLEARYPYGRFAKQAQLETAYAHYKLGNDGLAISSAQRFIEINPIHPAVDYAYYIIGLANFKESSGFAGLMTGKTNLADRDADAITDALSAFGSIVEKYPNSQYATDARKRTAYLQNAQAEHEVDIALFYFERNAFVASVNRCKYILTNYGSFSVREDALGVMYHSYIKMGLEDLASDTRRILRLNYPQSGYLSAKALRKPEKKGLVSRILKF